VRAVEQFTRTPAEWAEFKQEERRRTLAALFCLLAQARDERAEWYVWATEGQPRLTDEEYERVKDSRPRKRT
jgi:acyl-CoA reductase-like NAD-dependent aldehyde dehydrogenase